MRWNLHIAGAVTTLVATAILAGACASGDDVELQCDQAPGCVEAQSEEVSCEFTHPTTGPTTQTVASNQSFTFTVNAFELQPAGSCGARKSCGHAVLFVEGCDDVRAETHGNSVHLDVARCGEGEHRVVLVLHDDNHATLTRNGQPVSSVMTVVVKQGQACDCACHGGDDDKDTDSDKDTDKDSDSDKGSHDCDDR